MDKEHLSQLLKSSSVSGYEDEAIGIFIAKAKECGANTHIDILNNAFAQYGVRSAPITVMIDAHIDEIGFQVCYIDDNGLIYVRKVGLIDDSCLPGSVVEVLTNNGDKIKGVIGKKPVHLSSFDEMRSVPSINNLWVDTGLDSGIIKQQVSIGAPVCFSANLKYLGNNKISSKGIDNKIGVYVLTEVMKKVAGNCENLNVIFVASAQEEIGSRGAQFCAGQIKPDYAITIDVEFATDVPDCPKTQYGDIPLGRGVVLSKNLDSNRVFTKIAEDLAISNDIPHQFSAHYMATGDTNSSAIQLFGSCTKTLTLGIPCRYMHTPVEMVDIRDVESAIDLIEHIIKFIAQQHK